MRMGRRITKCVYCSIKPKEKVISYFLILSLSCRHMNLEIKETGTSPGFVFTSEQNHWLITGRCYHTEPKIVFEPMVSWIQNTDPAILLNCHIQFRLDFVATTSFKTLLEMLLLLKSRVDNNIEHVKLDWLHEAEDEDIIQTGEILMLACGMPIQFLTF